MCASYLKIPLKMAIFRIALNTYLFMYSCISYISMFAIMHFSFFIVFNLYIMVWDTYILRYVVYFCVFMVFIWISVIVSNDEKKIFNQWSQRKFVETFLGGISFLQCQLFFPGTSNVMLLRPMAFLFITWITNYMYIKLWDVITST